MDDKDILREDCLRLKLTEKDGSQVTVCLGAFSKGVVISQEEGVF